MTLLPFNGQDGEACLVPQRDSILTQKLVALSRRSDRRRLQKAYHKIPGITDNRRQVDAIEIRPRMADGCSMRKARAERRREKRARVLRQDARLLDYGGQSIRVPRRQARARRAERAASQSRRAIHSLSREPQLGTATRASRAPLRDGHLPLVPAKAGTQILNDRLDSRLRGKGRSLSLSRRPACS